MSNDPQKDQEDSEIEKEMIFRALEDIKKKSGYGFISIRIHAGFIVEVDTTYRQRTRKHLAGDKWSVQRSNIKSLIFDP